MMRAPPALRAAWERRARSRQWAVVRVVLGVAQMSGAIVCVVLIFREGASSRLLYESLSLTATLLVVSLLLFGRR